jgi:hypothetical protein
MNYNKLKIARDVLSKNQDDIANETGRTQTKLCVVHLQKLFNGQVDNIPQPKTQKPR